MNDLIAALAIDVPEADLPNAIVFGEFVCVCRVHFDGVSGHQLPGGNVRYLDVPAYIPIAGEESDCTMAGHAEVANRQVFDVPSAVDQFVCVVAPLPLIATVLFHAIQVRYLTVTLCVGPTRWTPS